MPLSWESYQQNEAGNTFQLYWFCGVPYTGAAIAGTQFRHSHSLIRERRFSGSFPST
jgi:hypothetical protein